MQLDENGYINRISNTARGIELGKNGHLYFQPDSEVKA